MRTFLYAVHVCYMLMLMLSVHDMLVTCYMYMLHVTLLHVTQPTPTQYDTLTQSNNG